MSGIDLFCGAGGLSQGLQDAGIRVAAGIDLDPACRFPFETNIDASFVESDVRDVTMGQLNRLWKPGSVRLLAGCAPCQPFSPYRRGVNTTKEKQWPLLAEFGRLALAARPEIVTMENVPRIGSSAVFGKFLKSLKKAGYHLDWRVCHCPDFGLAQNRRRLVLLGSLLGPLAVPEGTVATVALTVRDVIGDLPPIASGEMDPADPLHRSRRLSPLNLKRIRASKPGGTWEDWAVKLRAPCHQRATGASFRNVYARMEWGKPSPTITTLAHNFGTGRFGHPEQDRPISLREAAMLQGFPREYSFVAASDPVEFSSLGRLIGNAVPPPVGAAIGRAIVAHLRDTNQGAA